MRLPKTYIDFWQCDIRCGGNACMLFWLSRVRKDRRGFSQDTVTVRRTKAPRYVNMVGVLRLRIIIYHYVYYVCMMITLALTVIVTARVI